MTNTPRNRSRTPLTGLSGTGGGAPALPRRQLWIWPIVAALGLGVLGWFTSHAIERAMHTQLADQLQTILNADVESVRIWIKEQEIDAELIAAAAPLLPAVPHLSRLAEEPGAGLLRAKDQEVLPAHLLPRLKQYGYVGYTLVSPSLRILAARDEVLSGQHVDGTRAEFYRRVLLGRSAVSRPYPSTVLLADASWARFGPSARSGTADVPTQAEQTTPLQGGVEAAARD